MEQLRKRIEALVTQLKYYLYDIEYVKEHGDNILRVLIENDTEITLDDCVIVSEALGVMLDEDDPFEEPYNLEVTSSGAERELRTSAQIQRAVCKWVYVETFDQQVLGKLTNYDDGTLTLQMKNKKTTKIEEMDANLIRLAIVL